jgi:hypothetical protein
MKNLTAEGAESAERKPEKEAKRQRAGTAHGLACLLNCCCLVLLSPSSLCALCALCGEISLEANCG